MSAKQQLLDRLQNNFFQANIYTEYINKLIQINLEIMDLEEKEDNYKELIKAYMNNEIEDPNLIINKLKN